MNDFTKEMFEQAKSIKPDSYIPESVPESDIFGDSRNFYNPTPDPIHSQGNTQNGQNENSGNTTLNIGQQIPAAMAINIIDKAFTPLVVVGFGMAGYKVDKKQVQLTTEDKKFLEEPTENYLKTVNITLSPLEAMLLAFGSVYVSKAITVISQPKQPKQPKETNDLNANNEGAKQRKQRSDRGTKRGA
jgi:hypothetical protein